MKEFELEGTWWLPGRESEPVPGTLKFNADGLQLKVYGALHPVDLSPRSDPGSITKSVTEPMIYGLNREGREVTLFDSYGHYILGYPSSEEDYRPGLVLTGEHAQGNAFTEVQVEIEFLHEWADVPDLVKRRQRQYCFNATEVESLNAHSGDDVIKVFTSLLGTSSGTSVNLKQHSMLSVVTSERRGWRETFEEKVRPLHDLLTISLGRPLAMNALYLRPERSDQSNGALCDAVIDVLRPVSRPGHILAYSAPTLYTARDHDLGEVVTQWYAKYDRLRPILNLLLNPHYAPFIYGEHRYASLFQALEATHKEFFDSKDVDKELHAARVREVIGRFESDGVPPETVVWAKNVLTGRNDKPLRRQVEEVLDSTGPLGEHIRSKVPNFSQMAVKARTGVSHGGAQPMSPSSRYWIGEVLSWVMRSRILTELGVQGMYEKVLERDRYLQAISQISQ